MTETKEPYADLSNKRRDVWPSSIFVWRKYPTLHRQLLAIVCSFCGCCGCGVTLGFTGVLLPNIRKYVDDKQEPWIVGFCVLATPVGLFLGSFAMRKYGRKPTLTYSNVPWIIGWVLLATSSGFWTIFLGSGLVGFSNGFNNNAALVYAIEIAEPKLRGILSCVTQVSVAAGIFVGHLFGILFYWRVAFVLYTIFPALSFLFGFFLLETPNWLVIEGRTDEANKNFFWLRGVTAESQREYAIMMAKQAENTTKHERGVLKNVFSWQFFRPCLIMVTMFAATIGTGIDLLTYYALDILETLSTTIYAHNILILINGVRLTSTILSSILIKKLRRKRLYFLSSACTLLFLIGTIASLRFNLSDEFVIFNLCSFVGAENAGIVPISWIMIAEVFPQIVRDIGSGFVHMYVYFLEFVVMEAGPVIIRRLGLPATLCIFAIFSSACTVLLYFIMPETEEFTLQEIEDEIQKNKKETVTLLESNM